MPQDGLAGDHHRSTGARTTPGIVHRLALAFVWLTIASGAVVFAEPAPVDLLMLALIIGLPVIGLAPMRRELLVYYCAWLIVIAGGYFAATQASALTTPTIHTTVTLFLATGMLVLSCFVAFRPRRHVRLILNAHLVAASIAATAGVIGYFGLLPGSHDLFTKFGRAAGTFKDPNVFGPFVALAALYAIHLMITRPLRRILVPLIMFGFLALGLLLSFSRGAWISFALSLAVYGYLHFVTERRSLERVKMVSLFLAALLAGGLALTAALQFDRISSLMQERASLSQNYDQGPDGRFGGHEKARKLIVEYPMGLGAAEFQTSFHHEDVHNVYLAMFLNGGWLGGWMYLIVMLIPLIAGLVSALRRTAAQGMMHVVYGAYVGSIVEGLVIDTDHWRHLFLLIALVMGLAVAARRPAGPSASGREDPAGPAAAPAIPAPTLTLLPRGRRALANIPAAKQTARQTPHASAQRIDTARWRPFTVPRPDQLSANDGWIVGEWRKGRSR